MGVVGEKPKKKEQTDNVDAIRAISRNKLATFFVVWRNHDVACQLQRRFERKKEKKKTGRWNERKELELEPFCALSYLASLNVTIHDRG
jgi:hypothetical protein